LPLLALRELETDEADLLRAHAATCAFCTARLREYEMVRVAARRHFGLTPVPMTGSLVNLEELARETPPSSVILLDDIGAADFSNEEAVPLISTRPRPWRGATRARSANAQPSGLGALVAVLVFTLFAGLIFNTMATRQGHKPPPAITTAGYGHADYTPVQLPAPYTRPGIITRGPDGNLWFIVPLFNEFPGNAIGKMTLDGHVTEYAIPTYKSNPHGIIAGPDGNIWFTENAANKIGRITPDGAITEFALPTGSSPEQITAGPDGNLWFTESGRSVLSRMTPRGVLTEFPLSGPQFGITVGADGALWVSMETQVARVSTLGHVLGHYQATAGFIAAGPGGLWFSNDVGTLGRIAPDGSVLSISLPAGVLGQALASGPDGNLWVALAPTDGSSYVIGSCGLARVTPAGALTVIAGPNHTCAFRGAAFGSDGTLWVTDWGNNAIWRFRSTL
jgi:streptogramin lyase